MCKYSGRKSSALCASGGAEKQDSQLYTNRAPWRVGAHAHMLVRALMSAVVDRVHV